MMRDRDQTLTTTHARPRAVRAALHTLPHAHPYTCTTLNTQQDAFTTHHPSASTTTHHPPSHLPFPTPHHLQSVQINTIPKPHGRHQLMITTTPSTHARTPCPPQPISSSSSRCCDHQTALSPALPIPRKIMSLRPLPPKIFPATTTHMEYTAGPAPSADAAAVAAAKQDHRVTATRTPRMPTHLHCVTVTRGGGGGRGDHCGGGGGGATRHQPMTPRMQKSPRTNRCHLTAPSCLSSSRTSYGGGGGGGDFSSDLTFKSYSGYKLMTPSSPSLSHAAATLQSSLHRLRSFSRSFLSCASSSASTAAARAAGAHTGRVNSKVTLPLALTALTSSP